MQYFKFISKNSNENNGNQVNQTNKESNDDEKHKWFDRFNDCIEKYKKIEDMGQNIENIIYNKKSIEDKIIKDDYDMAGVNMFDDPELFDDAFLVSQCENKIKIFTQQREGAIKEFADSCKKFNEHDFSKYKEIDVNKFLKP